MSPVFRSLALALALVTLLFAPGALAQFTYNPPGQLPAGSGTGRRDSTVYAPGMRFPIENAPAWANSQVYGIGGSQGPAGSQCDARNYRYPWVDNYCEIRSWTMPMCPAGRGHQGQDIRPATCADQRYYGVSSVDGTVTNVGTYSVYITAADGTRYEHLHMRRVTVAVGQRVTRGQRIGMISNNMGSTPTSIHLHFNIRKNISGVGIVYAPTYMSLVRSYESLLGVAPPTAPRFRAQYVMQTFPLASTTLDLMPGQTFRGYLEMRNTGTATWTPGATRLGTTQPRDRPSAVADTTWIAPHRPAAIDRTVAPNATGRFDFTIRAPNNPGEYNEYFNLVQDGVAWFSDSGQGGPADNVIQVRVRVIAPARPRFAARFVSQSFPLASTTLDLTPGQEVPGYFELRNEGTETWVPGRTFLGTTEPRDRTSAVAAADWVSPSRPATVNQMVPTGQVGRFAFTVRAPSTVQEYREYFNLVQDGVAWFSETGNGGPADNQLQVRVNVIPASVIPDEMPDDASSEEDVAVIPDSDGGLADASVVMQPRDAARADGNASDGGDPTPNGGCACTVPAAPAPSRAPIALTTLLAAIVLRSRRRG